MALPSRATWALGLSHVLRPSPLPSQGTAAPSSFLPPLHEAAPREGCEVSPASSPLFLFHRWQGRPNYLPQAPVSSSLVSGSPGREWASGQPRPVTVTSPALWESPIRRVPAGTVLATLARSRPPHRVSPSHFSLPSGSPGSQGGSRSGRTPEPALATTSLMPPPLSLLSPSPPLSSPSALW